MPSPLDEVFGKTPKGYPMLFYYVSGADKHFISGYYEDYALLLCLWGEFISRMKSQGGALWVVWTAKWYL
jgi:hypothetical protein